MKCLWAILLALWSCTPAPEKRVDLEVTNSTEKTIIVCAQSAGFTRQIVLEPGDTWKGWIPKQGGQTKAAVEIKTR